MKEPLGAATRAHHNQRFLAGWIMAGTAVTAEVWGRGSIGITIQAIR